MIKSINRKFKIQCKNEKLEQNRLNNESNREHLNFYEFDMWISLPDKL